jgi:hypothetical protein
VAGAAAWSHAALDCPTSERPLTDEERAEFLADMADEAPYLEAISVIERVRRQSVSPVTWV